MSTSLLKGLSKSSLTFRRGASAPFWACRCTMSQKFLSSFQPTRGFSLANKSATHALNLSSWPYVPRRSMFIQTESTPNEDSLKFIPGTTVMGNGTAEFLDATSALDSPLAARIMAIEGVQTVFYGPDFVTVSKSPDTPWAVVKPEIYSMLMEFFSSGQSLFRSEAEREAAGSQDTKILDTDSETVAMIKEALETRVRPFIMSHGGDLEYRGFSDDGIVRIKLKGSCRGCDSSTATLKRGVERLLTYYIPEVKGVEQAIDPEEEVAADAFTQLEKRLGQKNSNMSPYMSI